MTKVIILRTTQGSRPASLHSRPLLFCLKYDVEWTLQILKRKEENFAKATFNRGQASEGRLGRKWVAPPPPPGERLAWTCPPDEASCAHAPARRLLPARTPLHCFFWSFSDASSHTPNAPSSDDRRWDGGNPRALSENHVLEARTYLVQAVRAAGKCDAVFKGFSDCLLKLGDSMANYPQGLDDKTNIKTVCTIRSQRSYGLNKGQAQ
ncbi:hypothetical protein CB1_000526046, partial [Camelus ferus]